MELSHSSLNVEDDLIVIHNKEENGKPCVESDLSGETDIHDYADTSMMMEEEDLTETSATEEPTDDDEAHYHDHDYHKPEIVAPIEVDIFQLAQKYGRRLHQHQLLVLVSLYGQANNREGQTQQNHTLTILQGTLGNTMEEPFLLVDASDPKHHPQRDALLELSGIGHVYPQFFLVQRKLNTPAAHHSHCLADLYDSIQFFGDYYDLHQANEQRTLRSSFLARKPLVRTSLLAREEDQEEEEDLHLSFTSQDEQEPEQNEEKQHNNVTNLPAGVEETGAVSYENENDDEIQEEEEETEEKHQDDDHEVASGTEPDRDHYSSSTLEADTEDTTMMMVPSSFCLDDDEDKDVPEDDGNVVVNLDRERFSAEKAAGTTEVSAQEDEDDDDSPRHGDTTTTTTDLRSSVGPEDSRYDNDNDNGDNSQGGGAVNNDAEKQQQLHDKAESSSPEKESTAVDPKLTPAPIICAKKEEVPKVVESPMKQNEPSTTVTTPQKTKTKTTNMERIKKTKPKKKFKENAICYVPDWVDTWMFVPTNPIVKMAERRSSIRNPDGTVETTTEATLFLRNGEQHTQKQTNIITTLAAATTATATTATTATTV